MAGLTQEVVNNFNKIFGFCPFFGANNDFTNKKSKNFFQSDLEISISE